jgi:hypothetical protein
MTIEQLMIEASKGLLFKGETGKAWFSLLQENRPVAKAIESANVAAQAAIAAAAITIEEIVAEAESEYNRDETFASEAEALAYVASKHAAAAPQRADLAAFSADSAAKVAAERAETKSAQQAEIVDRASRIAQFIAAATKAVEAAGSPKGVKPEEVALSMSYGHSAEASVKSNTPWEYEGVHGDESGFGMNAED